MFYTNEPIGSTILKLLKRIALANPVQTQSVIRGSMDENIQFTIMSSKLNQSTENKNDYSFNCRRSYCSIFPGTCCKRNSNQTQSSDWSWDHVSPNGKTRRHEGRQDALQEGRDA